MSMNAGSSDSTAQLLLQVANPSALKSRLLPLIQSGAIDWPQFADAAHRHRLLPLAHHHFSKLNSPSVPQDFANVSKRAYFANAARTEFLTAQLGAITGLLKDHKIRALPWKGPSFARLAYTDSALRPADDLDFLIHTDDRIPAIDALVSAGFTPCLTATKSALKRYLAAGNEYIMSSPHQDFSVELASRPLPPPFVVNAETDALWTPETPAIPHEQYFHFLCIHGAKHCWDRLIWISDLCAFLSAIPDLDLEKVTEMSKAARTGRMVSSALSLARLTGYRVRELDSLPPPIPQTDLLHWALDSDISAKEQTMRLCRLYSRRSDAISHVARWLLAPTYSDWQAINLPWNSLYWILRPIRVLASAMLRKRNTRRG